MEISSLEGWLWGRERKEGEEVVVTWRSSTQGGTLPNMRLEVPALVSNSWRNFYRYLYVILLMLEMESCTDASQALYTCTQNMLSHTSWQRCHFAVGIWAGGEQASRGLALTSMVVAHMQGFCLVWLNCLDPKLLWSQCLAGPQSPIPLNLHFPASHFAHGGLPSLWNISHLPGLS